MTFLEVDDEVVEIRVMSKEALCLREQDLRKLHGVKSKNYSIYHDDGRFIDFANVVTIVYAPEDNKRKKIKRKFYLADIKTGSLYDPDSLKCMSGFLCLR